MNDQLYILTSFNFNQAAGAAWSRVNNYAECLQNTDTKIYITSSAYDLSKDQIMFETANDIFQIRSSRLDNTRKSYIQQFRFSYYYKHYISLYQIISTNNPGRKILFLYSFNFSSVLMALLVFRIMKRQKIYCEKNELQVGIALNQPLPRNKKRYIPALLIKSTIVIAGLLQDVMTIFFNGTIVISRRFRNLYGKTNRKIITIPILANNMFFQLNRDRKQSDGFSICYTGDINQNKDGLLDFLNAISLIKNKRLTCDFYGKVSIEFHAHLDKMIQILEPFHTIKIHAEKPHDEVPQILAGYDLLILPRPRNLQTLYGFSTKLAEYLASSVPVLASKISDNDLYIEDGRNGFLCEPGNVKQLSGKINDIINLGSDKMTEIGLVGRKTAQEYFTISKYSSQLKSFFFS